jgi:hypothetical protein
MNRYIVRSLVAILTFSIGVAVGSFSQPSKSTNRQFRHKRCKEFVPERQVYRSVPQYPSPSVAIDNSSTDPLKLRYSHTRLSAPGGSRQTVQFTVEPTNSLEVSKFTINYRSRWSSAKQSGGGAVSVTNNRKTPSSGLMTFDSASSAASVAIECDSDETLSVWISSVEFKDGSRWENPRHRFN